MLNIIRNNKGKIISIDGYKRGDIIVFDRSIGGYSDCYFKIKDYWEDSNGRIFVRTNNSFALADDFFIKGCRIPTSSEKENMK